MPKSVSTSKKPRKQHTPEFRQADPTHVMWVGSVSRSEHEKRVLFNSDTYKPTKDEIRRFPSRSNKPAQPYSDVGYIRFRLIKNHHFLS